MTDLEIYLEAMRPSPMEPKRDGKRVDVYPVVNQLKKLGWFGHPAASGGGEIWSLQNDESNQVKGQRAANNMVKWLKANDYKVREDHKNEVHATNGEVYVSFGRMFEQNPVTKEFQSRAHIYTKNYMPFKQMLQRAKLA